MNNLPRNNIALRIIFKNATEPDTSEFSGEYTVDMLTVLPSLQRFAHRKVFHHDNTTVSGHNVLFSNTIWGHFFLEQGICPQVDSGKVIVINYNTTKNSFLTRRIRDHVRCIEKNRLYLGRFNLVVMGRPRFLGFFSLSKR